MNGVDRSFCVPPVCVAVIDCGATGEALLLRALVESMGGTVTLHQPGTPNDFLRVIGQGGDAPAFLVICGHGDESGLVFGEFAPHIDASSLVKGSLPAQAIAGRVNLPGPGRVVLSTACTTGSREFGEAFNGGAVRAYIAPSTYPDGADACLFLHHFFHNVLRRGADPEAAYLHARSYDEESAKFTLQLP